MTTSMQGLHLLSFITITCIASARISLKSSNSYSEIITSASNDSGKAINDEGPMTSTLGSASVPPHAEVKRMLGVDISSGFMREPRITLVATISAPASVIIPSNSTGTNAPTQTEEIPAPAPTQTEEIPAPAPKNRPITSTQGISVPAPTKGPITSTQGILVLPPTKGEGSTNRNSPSPSNDVRHLAPTPAEEPIVFKNKSRVKIVIIVAIVAAVLLAIIYFSYKMIYKPQPKKDGTTTSLHSSAANIEWKSTVQPKQVHSGLSSNLGMVSIIADEESGRILEMHAGLSSEQQHFLEPTEVYTNLSLDDTLYIKSYCRESHPIGQGSFARVYKMIFQGEVLAIKEIEHRSPHTKRWVQNEVDLLRGKEHININKLYAWSIEANISYLAYMYIDGCSLDDYLRGNSVGFSYSWAQSFSLILGIAKGIEFLHLNKIIHVDIKPQNIMVDANDNEAKIVDFGLSKHVNWEGTHRSTGMVVGTRGYWAPEYCWNNKISYKHDVYSFGIVVLEMITGQKHVDEARGSSQFHIPGYVRYMIENNRFEEAVDPKLKQDGWDSLALEKALAVANIALRCAHPDKAERPDMGLVLTELTSMMSRAHNHIVLEQKEEQVISR